MKKMSVSILGSFLALSSQAAELRVSTPVQLKAEGPETVSLCVPIEKEKTPHPLVRELYDHVLKRGPTSFECGYTVCDNN